MTTPCPACTRLGIDAQGCTARPKCVTCRSVTHLPAWGCCAGCVTNVDQMLGELLDLHALANHPAALMPGTAGNTGPSGAHRDPPPPLDLDTLDLAIGNDLLGVLESWERWWREHWDLIAYGQATETLPRPDLGNATLMHVIGFLRTWWPRAAAVLEPPPDEFADEVRRLHRHALAAMRLTPFDIDPDPDAVEPWDWTIRCPRDIDDQGTVCGNLIGMRHRTADEQPAELFINCPRCGTRWTATRLLLVAAAAGTPVELSVDDAMAHWGVSRATVYRMVSRGQARRGSHGRIAIGRTA